MQISMKCSVAIHCLIFINESKGKAKVTSNLLSESTGCNPVVIRNIMSGLKKSGLIIVPRGTGGAQLCIDPSEITLYQIYSSLEHNGISNLMGIHSCKGAKCPIAKNIKQVLYEPYHKIEDSLKQAMESITLQSIIDDFHTFVQKSK